MQTNTDLGADPTAPPTSESRRSFSGERYRAKWRWDNVVKGTHLLNCWYQRSCAYNVYVKGGAVAFEEPVGEYPRTNASVPDANPRGCQNGRAERAQYRRKGSARQWRWRAVRGEGESGVAIR